MGKIRSFLGVFMFLFSLAVANTVLAAGYTCDDYKQYTSCEPGYYLSSNKCVECPAGYKCTGGTADKVACTKGSYQNSTKQSSCKTPSDGYYVDTDGATSQKSCKDLNAFYTGSDNGRDAATDCYGLTTAGNFIKTAKSGEETCDAGGYCPGNVEVYYNSTGGRTGCGEGMYNDATGSSLSSACKSITAGCYGTSATSACPTVCANNKYSDAGASSCTSCDSDYANSGTTAASHAGVASCKVTCAAGKYVASANAACTDVGDGYYRSGTETVSQGNTGSRNACKNLNAFYTSSDSSRDADTDCYGTTTAGNFIKTAKSGQATCDAGGYCPGSSKVYYDSTGGRTPCSAGTYNANTGSSAASACVACATGSYSSGTGNTACTACQNGTTTSGTGKTSCDATCSNNNSYDNTWKTATWSANSLTNLCTIDNCKAGSKYASASGGSCTACDKGSYMASSAHTTTSCTSAGSGYYVDTTGATSRKACKDLDTSKTDGTYTSVSPYNASTTCRFTQNAQTVPAYCETKTSNTMSYSGSAWPANTYSVTAKAGSYVVNNNTADATCSQCTACDADETSATCSLAVTNNQCVYTTACLEGYKNITNSGEYNPSCEPIQYTIEYNANGGSGSTANSTHKYNKSAVLSTNGFRNGNKMFLGWSESSTATTATYANKATVSNLSSTDGATITLYAVWGDDCTCSKGTGVQSCEVSVTSGICGKATATAADGYNTATCAASSSTGVSKCTAIANKYTVKFNKNDANATGTMSNQSFQYDEAQELATNEFDNPGLKFQGWATSAEGSAVYSDGESVSNLTTTNNGTYNLYAVWGDAEIYSITYENIDGATHDNASSYTVTTPVTFKDATMRGYSFMGWFSDAGLNNRITKTSGTGNITVYAKWEQNPYKITYECGDGGDKVLGAEFTKDVLYNGSFTTQPGTICTRRGYSFAGWDGEYSDANKTYTYTTVGNTTLTAKWEINSYTCAPGLYLKSTTLECTKCPTNSYCEGGTFEYIYNQDQGVKNCPDDFKYSGEGSDAKTNCYANVYVEEGDIPTNCASATWTACTYKDYYGATEKACIPTVASVTAVAGAYVSGTTCVVCGTDKYQTKNDTTATSCSSSCATGYTITGTTVADHDSQSDCYRNVTLNKNGGSGNISTSVTCYEGVSCDFGSAASLTQSGYTFTGGWGTSTSCTSLTTKFTTPSVTTYYACKTPNKYTISFDANGGTGGQTSSVEATYNSAMPAISETAPALAGYIFTGWFSAKTGGTQYYTASGTSAHNWDITENRTLYAQWSVGGMNTVVYNENGGTDVVDGECNVLSADVTLPTTTRDGHTFDGWYNDATGVKTTVIPSGTCTSSMSFTAHWNKCASCSKGTGVSSCAVSVSNNTCVASATCSDGYEAPSCTGLDCKCEPKQYTVNYSCGEGTGNAPSNGTAVYNSTFVPADNTCTPPDGYKFSTWNDGNNNRVAGTGFTWTYTSGKTMTAQYSVAGATDIDYQTGGGIINGDYVMACNAQTPSFELPTDVVRPGYKFNGWKDESGASVTYVTQGTCTTALTFIAQWSECNSTTDGDCSCAAGTYPKNGVCTSCATACSSLGTEYMGEYNVCRVGDAEAKCYKDCESQCVAKDTCPENFLRCKYATSTMIAGYQYYGDSSCIVEDPYCPIDLNNSQTYCSSGYYLSEKYPNCTATCSSLEPTEYYYYSISATLSNGPNACYDQCVPTCNYANDYILGTDGKVTGETVNHCPEHATCTEGTLPTQGYRWYPQEVCTPIAFCSFTFVCDPGYVANTTKAVQYGYRKTLYGSPMTASDTANCAPGTYAITLNNNNNDESQTVYQTYTVGWHADINGTQALETITLPTRTGYTFIGYYDAQTGGSKIIDTNGILPANNTYTADTTLYAHWKANIYTITYHLDGSGYDTEANPESYTIEDTPIMLANPAKLGYTFDGWFSDSDNSMKVTEIPKDSTGNKEFWTKWKPVEYTITYNTDGGDKLDARNYTIKDTPFDLPIPTKTGYIFTKWIDASGNTVTQIAKDTVGNMVLTAVWASDTYLITYNMNGGINNSDNPNSYAISDTPIELKDPVKTGYIFDGWTGDKVVNNAIMEGATGNTTVTANWTPTEFTVHFDPTDATGVTVPDVICIYDQECTAPGAVQMDYKTFSVWNTQKDGKGKTVLANGDIKNLISDGGEITLYAVWDQNMVSCKKGYYYNSGIEEMCVLGQYCPGTGEINEGSTGCIETCPAGGQTVVDGANSITQCRKITTSGGDMTFSFGTAKWDCAYTSGTGDAAVYQTGCDSIALTCDAGYYYNGVGNACVPVTDGYYSPAPEKENGVEYPESMKAHACPGETGASDDGIGSDLPRAAITNCYKACSLTGADVAHSKTVTPDETKAFSSVSGQYSACSYTITCGTGYTPQNGTNPQCIANKYVITLDKNQGTGDVVASIECTFDSGACMLPANSALTRAGYVSANKWCTSANGSGVCYTAGATTSENISSTGTDTKLYAIWEPDVFKIDLLATDATENATQSTVYLKYTVGWFADAAAKNALSSINTSALPVKPGYNFAGYSIDDVIIVDAYGTLQNTSDALQSSTNDTIANVIWTEGDTTCPAGYYYSGTPGECSVCMENHWCPGGTFPSASGIVAGHETCPENGLSVGGVNATSIGVCYKQALPYTSTTGKATGTQTCNYDDAKKSYSASCRDISVKACDAGFWYDSTISDKDCIEVGKNYYSADDDLIKYACPEDGITGALTTASNVGECYKTVPYQAIYGTGTQVCNYTSKNDDGSAKYVTNCRDQYITACQGGYYRENASAVDCKAVGQGAYSEASSLDRIPCPDGGDTTVENAEDSRSCFKAENPFVAAHGSGFQYCSYSPENKGYTECRARMFQKCEAGYYWNAIGDEDCIAVGYGFFGPVADSGNEGRPTARQACATFDGRDGQTETDTSATAAACFMTEMPCSVNHGSGIKTCGYNMSSEDYSADCTTCMLDTCEEKYYLNSNQCAICPSGSVCDINTRTGFNGVANAAPQVCSTLFNGRYPESDAGSVSVAQCFGTCDLLQNTTTMIGRDYQGFEIADTCEIKQCEQSYYLTNTKSSCVFCPENSICNAASGSDLDEDGTPDDTPHTCTELTNGTHELSNAGSTEINSCYTTCEDYKILGGTAIRDSDTVQYDNVCTYKGVSETGNPCEIHSINGVETCIETSCNPDYELIDGHCQKCNRENATGYKPDGNCLVAKCHNGYHPDGDQCADDIKMCNAPNAVSATQVWNTKLGAFGICTITECIDGYHVSSNACVPDTEVCNIEHGKGIREWDYNRNTWGECIATSCDAGYTSDPYESDEPNKQCGRCRNAKSILGLQAASTYTQGCEISACLYQGELYNLENNECVPICPTDKPYEDETGSMIWDNSTKKCKRECADGYMSW